MGGLFALIFLLTLFAKYGWGVLIGLGVLFVLDAVFNRHDRRGAVRRVRRVHTRYNDDWNIEEEIEEEEWEEEDGL